MSSKKIEVNDKRGKEKVAEIRSTTEQDELDTMGDADKKKLIQRLGTVAQQQKNYIDRLQSLIVEKDFEIANLRAQLGDAKQR